MRTKIASDTHRKSYVLFNSMQEWLLDYFLPFHMFTQSIKFYIFHYHVLKNADV